ncbi:hypothetical protein BWK56_04020 [Candidatus Liberibacter asiaticus]|nr:dual specificity protein phosphatase family protein [Candidatus Liberibacter asiaticus]OMH86789.1 hypothetical protein BWK56_04020 [Candidatus Liberibacter asiaticus]
MIKIKEPRKNLLIFYIKILLGVLVLCAVSLGLYFLTITTFTQNFHAVVPHEIYRSAQPNGTFIEYLKKEYGIKSILNLRGKLPESWHKEEEKAANDLGIQLINFPLSATRELNDEQIKQLISILKTAPKPLLIHCKSGADRTGLASAVYLYIVAHYPKEEAHRQLSMLYGHFPVLKTITMDITFEKITQLYPNNVSKGDTEQPMNAT